MILHLNQGRLLSGSTGRFVVNSFMVLWLMAVAGDTAWAAAAGGSRFDGKHYRGRGDVEYLRLLETARRMFAPDPELQNLAMLYEPKWNGLVEGPPWGAWWIKNSYGATYAISSDPRTSTTQLEDLSDVTEKVKVVWRSDAIIPTLNVTFSNKSSPDVSSRVVELTLEYANLENGTLVLSNLTDYQIEGIEEASDALYTRLTQLVDASGIDLVAYLGY